MGETATTTTTAPETTAPATGATTQATNAPESTPAAGNSEKLEAVVQSAVDRATNKLGNENKKLRTELEALKKANMDADELKQFELSEKEKEIAQREKELTEKENRWTAMKAIKEAGLDDGSEESMSIVDFVMAEDEEKIKERVKSFNSLVERIVKSKVDAVFKANGRTPGVGSDSTAAATSKNDSVAVRIGKEAAETNKKSRSIIDNYLRR